MSFSYKELVELIMEALECDSLSLLEQNNLVELGLTSLATMQLVNRLRERGIKVSFSELMLSPYIKDWWKLIKINSKKNTIKKSDFLEEKNTESFPLTEVQQAYWIGRGENQILGGVSCHAYFEFKCISINEYRLQVAWNKIQNRHSMLRAKILDNGEQIINGEPYRDGIVVYDLRKMNEEKKNKKLDKIRYVNSHRVLKVKEGQVAELELSLLDDRNSIIHFDIDLLVADLKSLKIIFSDLAKMYNEEKLDVIPSEINFANYIFNKNKNEHEDMKKGEEFWKVHIDKLSNGPELPYFTLANLTSKHRFKRRNYILDKNKWNLLKHISKQMRVTPAMILLTLFSKILDRYSTSENFIINVPIFNRPIEYKDIVGDFTNIVLLNLENNIESNFFEDVKKTQNNFLEIMKFSSYSGVDVIRDVIKRDKENKLVAPVVFSCDYGQPIIDDNFEKTFGKLNFISTQTPQVVIDFQVIEVLDGLMLSWDAVDEVFQPDIIDDMFNCYLKGLDWILENQCTHDTNLPILDKEKFEYRYKNIINMSNREKSCLHKKFFENAKKNPNQIAIIEANKNNKTSYGELSIFARKMASYLKEKDITRGDKIAIRLPRGRDQIIAILAILSVGACYVPISMKQPENRIKKILKKSKAKVLITNSLTDISYDTIPLIDMNLEAFCNYDEISEIEELNVDELAYIIFTSGTTGEPKGVKISHQSAWNTIQDVNFKCNVDEKDKLLSVSALEFDLSVYDIFGMLSKGGTLVLIDEQSERNPSVWLSYMKKYEITLWNSVPFLFEMLLSEAREEGGKLPILRKILLSGDWIGIDLPERLKIIAKNAEIFAMGGATEASIWSNYFEVKNPLPKEWVSIPYGNPLDGQLYRVVDKKGRDCPNWVSGELWIGGQGVAEGYAGDPKLTKEKFKEFRGIRWYRTGDLGKFWGDGTIEFLGRNDNQVKIKGHRIELGEIEAILEKFPRIKNSIVCSIGDYGSKKLGAYILCEKNCENTAKCNEIIDINELKEFLRLSLPEYMIPKVYYFSNTIPTSQNGKVDRNKISKILTKEVEASEVYLPPQGELEQEFEKIWKDVLGVKKVSRFDNFFEIGGDSLKAVTLVSKLKRIVNDSSSVSIQTLFEAPTIEAFVQEVSKKDTQVEIGVI